MTWQPSEDDPEEADRVQRAVLADVGHKQAALIAARCCHGSFEAALLGRPAEMMDEIDLALLDRIAWHYRRHLPAHMRPPLTRHDPVARELESAHG